MRRKLVKPKERRKVEIPSELRDAMREVFERIQQARHDPDIVLDFDDAIQVEGILCGGRYGQKARPYVLTYFPEFAPRCRWYLTLARTEIEDIGDGVMTQMMLYCCTAADCQCKFREESETCGHCDYDDDPPDGS